MEQARFRTWREEAAAAEKLDAQAEVEEVMAELGKRHAHALAGAARQNDQLRAALVEAERSNLQVFLSHLTTLAISLSRSLALAVSRA